VYSKEIQTTDGSLEAPQVSEEEIRKQITEEFEQREKQKIAQLEEEIKRLEQEKHEEIKGLTYIVRVGMYNDTCIV
jgi:dynein intermediate chain